METHKTTPNYVVQVKQMWQQSDNLVLKNSIEKLSHLSTNLQYFGAINKYSFVLTCYEFIPARYNVHGKFPELGPKFTKLQCFVVAKT